ncbi:hypothetical protein [Vibrio toranzoniae]|uniref:hypothetical protein n=1 Tax=Vibrio toranzoniae TaxID=1194427 RepID=UPI0013775A90|nr:hypothetical protein [Vibrio toranzoniae]NAZ92244.1 hypothetical protein [Vibrio toranzoniae]
MIILEAIKLKEKLEFKFRRTEYYEDKIDSVMTKKQFMREIGFKQNSKMIPSTTMLKIQSLYNEYADYVLDEYFSYLQEVNGNYSTKNLGLLEEEQKRLLQS